MSRIIPMTQSIPAFLSPPFLPPSLPPLVKTFNCKCHDCNEIGCPIYPLIELGNYDYNVCNIRRDIDKILNKSNEHVFTIHENNISLPGTIIEQNDYIKCKKCDDLNKELKSYLDLLKININSYNKIIMEIDGEYPILNWYNKYLAKL